MHSDHGRRRRVLIVLFVAMAALVAACAPASKRDSDHVNSPKAHHTWWAMGDSVFSGVEGYFSPAAYMEETYNAARAGNTLTQVYLNGNPQITLMQHVQHQVGRWGAPKRVMLHAGGADMLVRSAHSQGAPNLTPQAIIDAAVEIEDYLRSFGVEEIRWLTIIPTSSWGGLAPMHSMRQEINELLPLAFPGRVIDCEEVLLQPGTRWMKNEFQVYDGVHLNNIGARALAKCIAEDLDLTYAPNGQGNTAAP